ncbi:galactose-1-phosphate uridylyltransferase [Chytriomyces sp. MP71]|nr:galactose-1-phosphate uridylyltransferase [Chytriomyces sp. MP71]
MSPELNDDAIHRRFNPLTQAWVLCSPHRARRPWLGQNEASVNTEGPVYDPKCYLCPGNTRAPQPNSTAVHMNPQYEGTFVFANDFPALKLENAPATASSFENSQSDTARDLFVAKEATGVCKVICFSPKHNLTLAEMDQSEALAVVKEWINVEENIREEGEGRIQYVQVFENKGAVMGCSNPHPHGQAWATDFIPQEPDREFHSLMDFKKKHDGKCMLCVYAELEEQDGGSRVVYSNEHFLVVVPYWATWPFETLVVSKSHAASIKSLSEAQQASLADALLALTVRYDNLFETCFPYSMGIHGAPLVASQEVLDAAHLHLHFYPPLLRSATVKKFLVGYEMLGEGQRDLTAEMAAERLKALPDLFYYSSN